MRRTWIPVVLSAAVLGCSEAPTPTQTQDLSDPTVDAKVTPTGTGGSSVTPLGNTGVLLAPPNFSPGSCLFVPDGDLNGFIRIDQNGKAYLKVNDHSGTIIVTPLGGVAWVGTGRATIDWPNYRGNPANNVNMQVDGDVTANGQNARASCHYLVAGGKKVQESLQIQLR